MLVIPALERLRQEDHKFKANLGYVAKLFQKPILLKVIIIRKGGRWIYKSKQQKLYSKKIVWYIQQS
jgi:uncharacterized protein with PhoU and TrkA domain